MIMMRLVTVRPHLLMPGPRTWAIRLEVWCRVNVPCHKFGAVEPAAEHVRLVSNRAEPFRAGKRERLPTPEGGHASELPAGGNALNYTVRGVEQRLAGTERQLPK